MGGAPIAAGQTAASQCFPRQARYPPGSSRCIVFEDDFPLNGEQDAGGGVDILAPNEPGLGGFQIHLWDAMGGNGDFTGQMTYDMFNQPLTNSLDGTIDPVTGLDACPVTKQGLLNSANGGITGMIVTCPKYEADGSEQTLSPLAGQAVIKNLMPGRYCGDRDARRRPHRARRGMAADQHPRRPEGARHLHPHRRAELFPGVRPRRAITW